jgi:thiosulfate/3-mercaptopyruvate sulfurtransferase
MSQSSERIGYHWRRMNVPEHNLSPIISTEWLASHMDNTDLRIIDVRWKFKEKNGKGVGYDDHAGYQAAHIPGAVFARMVEDLSDQDHPIPDMMVQAEAFAAVMGQLGVNNDTHVVIYDDSGIPLAAARLWWALSYYGHDRVRVLDGGLLQWKLENHPISQKMPEYTPTTFEPNVRPNWLAEKSDVIKALDDPGTIIIDCLPNELYRGHGEHTWGNRTGHVPGAVNVPAVANLHPDLAHTTMAERAEQLKMRGSFKLGAKDMLAAHYAEKGLKTGGTAITYCGRGVAASCGLLVLRYLGIDNSRLYDGSWAEWSSDEELPIEKS